MLACSKDARSQSAAQSIRIFVQTRVNFLILYFGVCSPPDCLYPLWRPMIEELSLSERRRVVDIILETGLRQPGILELSEAIETYIYDKTGAIAALVFTPFVTGNYTSSYGHRNDLLR